MTGATARSRVLVVGGGYGGRAVAKALDSHLDVTLVTERQQFLHNVPALRAVAVDGYADKLLIGYDKLLQQGRIVHGDVAGVDDRGADLRDGTRLDADYVVVATGSSYPFPGKAPERSSSDIRNRYHQLRTTVNAASSVLILGAGPVGLELAGELIAARPILEITLLEPGPVLLPGPYQHKLRRRLTDTLTRWGVTIILSDRVHSLPKLGANGEVPTGATITTRAGRRLTPDLVFTAYGARPRNEALTALSDSLDERGRLRVDQHLQVIGHPRVLAVGDITNVDEPKQAVVAEAHAKIAAATVRALAAGNPPRKTYRVSKTHPVLIPLGPHHGAGQLPIGSGVIGRRLTRAIKGRTLFAPRYRKLLGHP